jgi:hypothetical protein
MSDLRLFSPGVSGRLRRLNSSTENSANAPLDRVAASSTWVADLPKGEVQVFRGHFAADNLCVEYSPRDEFQQSLMSSQQIHFDELSSCTSLSRLSPKLSLSPVGPEQHF